MHKARRSTWIGLLFIVIGILVAMTADTALAQGPTITIRPIMAPRQPKAIPHRNLVGLRVLANYPLPQASYDAAAAAQAQGTAGKPGVLQTVTGIANGIYLYPTTNVCNDFNLGSEWQGEVWTSYFAGWGTYARIDSYYHPRNVTFDREQVIGPGNRFGPNEASMKIASNQPYEAGVMSPQIPVQVGDTVMVRVKYLIYNHDWPDRTWDYVSMGIIPRLGAQATYVNGYQRGEWAVLEQEITTQGLRVIVMLQGHSPDAINSNIYFDDVEIYINGVPVQDCTG